MELKNGARWVERSAEDFRQNLPLGVSLAELPSPPHDGPAPEKKANTFSQDSASHSSVRASQHYLGPQETDDAKGGPWDC